MGSQEPSSPSAASAERPATSALGDQRNCQAPNTHDSSPKQLHQQHQQEQHQQQELQQQQHPPAHVTHRHKASASASVVEAGEKMDDVATERVVVSRFLRRGVLSPRSVALSPSADRWRRSRSPWGERVRGSPRASWPGTERARPRVWWCCFCCWLLLLVLGALLWLRLLHLPPLGQELLDEMLWPQAASPEGASGACIGCRHNSQALGPASGSGPGGSNVQRRGRGPSLLGRTSPGEEARTECPALERAHAELRHVVLIINTNYKTVALGTTEFLRSVYGRIFDNIVVVSVSSIPQLGVEARGQRLWRDKWYFAFWHIPKIVADYPNAEGYLWTNDDVAINYWNLIKGNRTKLWLTNDPKHPECRYFPFAPKVRAKWTDWAADEVCRKKAGQAYVALETKYKRQFDRSVQPHEGTYPKRIVDLFYIPQRFAKDLSFDLIPIFREFKLWSEVAVPMMFYALDHPSNYDHVLDDMKYSWRHWDKKRDFDPLWEWSPHVSAFHPWKLSQPPARVKLLRAFSLGDRCILQLLPNGTGSHEKSLA